MLTRLERTAMKKVNAKAPGKLFIAGEYAVVEPEQPSVIVAIDRFISVTVFPVSTDFGTLHSKVLSDQPLKWTRSEKGLTFAEPAENTAIVKAAIDVAETYLTELGKPLSYYDMLIESEMVNEEGIKYGLGSSGAVTVAVIEALLNAYSVSVSDLSLYKLASLAHLSLNSNGSFGDLAAASFTGWIAYTRFNQKSLLPHLKKLSIKELIARPWDQLSIEPLLPPESLSLLVGWTGTPASTESLVSQSKSSGHDSAFSSFLEASKACVSRLIKALKAQDSKGIMREISLNRELLLEMADKKSIELETPLLHRLCKVAGDHFASAKTSGAGGGDCGIALIPKQFDSSLLTTDWEAEGIVPLDITVYKK